MPNTTQQFDVAVIGGGPAGMMAAGRAAELGAKVVLIEKNKLLGRKLLITGKGRCNITQALFEPKEFIEKLGTKNKFLFSSLTAFGPQEVIDFFEKRGLATKTERGGRVFPVSDNAQDVVDVLRQYMRESNVTLLRERTILKLKSDNGLITGIHLKHPHDNKAIENITANQYIICAGGKSYPATGSTGDGYAWAQELGHTIIPPTPALVPIATKEQWAKDLQGLSLRNIQINIFQNNKKQDERFGEMLFTHWGLSGPIILDVSKKLGQLLKDGPVTIKIDLKPALDYTTLDLRLQKDFATHGSKEFKNYLPQLLPQKAIDTFIRLSGIDAHKKVNDISKDERKKLLHLLKQLTVNVAQLLDFTHAIVTTGGVSLKEVDSKTMRSKIVPNLSFAGEVLDLDGPTGGYNLQICWSTGFTAGTHAVSQTRHE